MTKSASPQSNDGPRPLSVLIWLTILGLALGAVSLVFLHEVPRLFPAGVVRSPDRMFLILIVGMVGGVVLLKDWKTTLRHGWTELPCARYNRLMRGLLQMGRGLTRISLLIVAFSLSACSTNPYTHRSQLLMIPASQEMAMGAQAYEQVLHDPKMPPSRDPREVEPVKRVAGRIIEAAKKSKYADMANKFDWEVTVIKDDKTMNAFALPGGKIAVYTGIFNVAKNEAGLAAILGHEVTHALARHGGERVSQGYAAQGALLAGAVALGASGVSSGTQQLALLAGGALATYGFILPYSRTHESEADYIGLLLAADAGYDPREAVHVWQRMQEVSKGQPPEFLSTHPGHGTRIKQLQEWMPEALAHYHPQPGLQVAELPHEPLP